MKQTELYIFIHYCCSILWAFLSSHCGFIGPCSVQLTKVMQNFQRKKNFIFFSFLGEYIDISGWWYHTNEKTDAGFVLGNTGVKSLLVFSSLGSFPVLLLLATGLISDWGITDGAEWTPTLAPTHPHTYTLSLLDNTHRPQHDKAQKPHGENVAYFNISPTLTTTTHTHFIWVQHVSYYASFVCVWECHATLCVCVCVWDLSQRLQIIHNICFNPTNCIRATRKLVNPLNLERCCSSLRTLN